MSQDLVRERTRRDTLRLPQPGDHISFKSDNGRVWTGQVTEDPITVHTNNHVQTFTMTIKQYPEAFREWPYTRAAKTDSNLSEAINRTAQAIETSNAQYEARRDAQTAINKRIIGARNASIWGDPMNH